MIKRDYFSSSYLPSTDIWGGSQPPVTPDAGNLLPFLAFEGALYMCSYISAYT